jgi:hypothetical protein
MTEDSDSVWDVCINDRPFTFRKTRQSGVFLYTCMRKDTKSVTSFLSDKNLTPDELEAMPQFIAFISATM